MKTAINNATIFDGNETMLQNGSILFDESGILQISRAPFSADRVIDGKDKTVMPGLIDCHVHLGHGLSEKNDGFISAAALTAFQARDLWQYGITTVRNCGSAGNVDIYVRDLIDQNIIKGVRIIACGKAICITGGHAWSMSYECDTVDEVRKAARMQLRMRANHIKLIATGGMGTKGSIPNASQLTEEQMRAAVEEAQVVGAFTTAHCTGLEGARRAIRAGVHSIEHIQLDQDTAELMKEHGSYYCPTIITRYNIINCTDPEFIWLKAKASPGDLERKEKALRLCKKLGVTICAGTDSGVSTLTPLGESLSDELRIYTEYGLTNMEALRAANKNAAEMLCIDGQTGTLEEKKDADIAVFHGNPLIDMKALKNVYMTFQRGELCYANPAGLCDGSK